MSIAGFPIETKSQHLIRWAYLMIKLERNRKFTQLDFNFVAQFTK